MVRVETDMSAQMGHVRFIPPDTGDTVASRRGLEARVTGRPCTGALIEDTEKGVHQTALSGPLSWPETVRDGNERGRQLRRPLALI